MEAELKHEVFFDFLIEAFESINNLAETKIVLGDSISSSLIRYLSPLDMEEGALCKDTKIGNFSR